MEKMKNNIIFFCFFIALSLFFCSDNDDNISDIDPKIIGVWYEKKISNNSYSEPIYSISGIQITEDSAYRLISVNWQTGKLSLRDDILNRKVVCGKDGIIIIKNLSGTIWQDTMNYQFNHDTLCTMSVYEYNNTFDTSLYYYVRGNIGEKVIEPIPNSIRFLLNDSLAESYVNYPYLPVYGAYKTRFSINASFQSAMLIMNIDCNVVPGVYTIGGESGNYCKLAFFGYPHWGYYETDNLNGGILEISEVDWEKNRVKGTFQIKVIKKNDYGTLPSPEYYELKEGNFDIPLYR